PFEETLDPDRLSREQGETAEGVRDHGQARKRLPALDGHERLRFGSREALLNEPRQPLAPAGGSRQQDEESGIRLRGQPPLTPLGDALELLTLIRWYHHVRRDQHGSSRSWRIRSLEAVLRTTGGNRLQARRWRDEACEHDRPLIPQARQRRQSRRCGRSSQ